MRETLLLKGGVWGQEEKAQMEREEGSLGRTLKRKFRDEHSLPTERPLLHTPHSPPQASCSRGQHPLRPAACKPASPRFESGISGSGVLLPEKQRACEAVDSESGIQALGPDQAILKADLCLLCEARRFEPESQRCPVTNPSPLGISLGFCHPHLQPHLPARRSGLGAAGGLRWCSGAL